MRSNPAPPATPTSPARSASSSPRAAWRTLYLHSRALLAARAAGLEFPLVGIWEDLKDPEGAREFAIRNRQLGFRGMVLIHPSHVAMANEVFTPSADDVAFFTGMIAAFAKAEAAGNAATTYEGHHIDYAHIKTAHDVLALHKQLTGG